MTPDNYDRKKQYAALIMGEYPSFPDDPMTLAQQAFGDSEVTDEAWEAEKTNLAFRVANHCIVKHTNTLDLVASGMSHKAALAVNHDAWLRLYNDWQETPAMLRQRAKDAKYREKWLRKLQRRVGT